MKMYGLILSDEKLHEAFSDVCSQLKITVRNISGEDKTKKLDEEGIDEFVNECEKKSDVFEQFTERAKENQKVMDHLKNVMKQVESTQGGGSYRVAGVPEAFFVAGLPVFVLGFLGYAFGGWAPTTVLIGIGALSFSATTACMRSFLNVIRNSRTEGSRNPRNEGALEETLLPR